MVIGPLPPVWTSFMDDPKPCGIFRNLSVITRQKVSFWLPCCSVSQSSHPIWRPKRSVEADSMTHVLVGSLAARPPLCAILIMVKPLEIASGGRELRRITYLRLTTTVATNGHEIEGGRGGTSKVCRCGGWRNNPQPVVRWD